MKPINTSIHCTRQHQYRTFNLVSEHQNFLLMLFVCLFPGLVLAMPYNVDQDFNPAWFEKNNSINREFIHSGRFNSAYFVQAAYEENSYRPLWRNRMKDPVWLADVRHALNDLHFDALPLGRYHQKQLSALINMPEKSWLWDLYLTDAIVTAIGDLSGKSGAQYNNGKYWQLAKQPASLLEIVTSLRYGNTLTTVLRENRPSSATYRQLRRAYIRSAELPETIRLGKGEDLRCGSEGEQVFQLAQILEFEGLLHEGHVYQQNPVMDKHLEKAVIEFQQLHRIKVDGIVGVQTRAALNSGPEKLSDRIAHNLQRFRNKTNFESMADQSPEKFQENNKLTARIP